MASDGYPWNEVFTTRLHQAIREILLVNDLDHSDINNSNHHQTTLNNQNKGEQSVSDPADDNKEQQSIGPFGAGWWTALFPGFSEGIDCSTAVLLVSAF